MNWAEKDKAYIWHPFTQMKLAGEAIHIERAEGCYLYSSNGDQYLDGISSWWVNIHGHAHPYIAEKIAQQCLQLEHVIFAGFTHTPAIKLAEKLLALLPGSFSKVFYSDNGSTAVEVALKMALQYWYNKGEIGKTKIIAFEDAYHGDTFGAMSVGARSVFTAAFQELLFDVVHIPLPSDDNIDQCTEMLQQMTSKGDVAAFIFEPLVLGAAGMKMYKPEHLDMLLAVAKRNGVLCIADEVMTGFGRSGKNFAIEHLVHRPDIICLSKGITGGFLPLSVTICTEDIYQAFYSDEATKALFHGHSYTANPVACAAALASMEILTQPETQQQIRLIAQEHHSFLQNIKDHPFIKGARQTGTILALEIKTTENTSYFNLIRDDAYNFCLGKGVLLRPLGNIIYFMPPYCITQTELQLVYGVIIDMLHYLQEKYT
ncbi:adenosylmethionine--8-amino-7-oxononanoate transaminase [Chitinophagaceae bacterium LB-8]|uniref:Adenosylmethionine-8-amino-7-oxononanoate aminotransferase n=1 Tax=Paraflavisolibacter caeni TaxID=2982496 RepID=A0A9X3BGT8_9BACT|nr:adenosylmethionine--8-amino-7-oxononanoate transaminase [Paraflavisolibacter caeni]MCU7548108.1 adenosylmethionine--8-amino-7-oxononanoate transaminase [Paraflavisolibacter caeni]